MRVIRRRFLFPLWEEWVFGNRSWASATASFRKNTVRFALGSSEGPPYNNRVEWDTQSMVVQEKAKVGYYCPRYLILSI